MISLTDILFGPLDKLYCIYFYFLSIIGILFGIFLCIFYIIYPSLLKITTFISMLIISFMVYFQNRLLFQMCIHSFYYESYTPLNENDLAREDMYKMELPYVIDFFKNFFSGKPQVAINALHTKNEVNKTANEVYTGLNKLALEYNVDPLLIAKFINDTIPIEQNKDFWINYYNTIKQKNTIQYPQNSAKTVMENTGRYDGSCSNKMPINCPVAGDTPFCTSTGWACPHMWTFNSQNYEPTNTTQINPKDLIVGTDVINTNNNFII